MKHWLSLCRMFEFVCVHRNSIPHTSDDVTVESGVGRNSVHDCALSIPNPEWWGSYLNYHNVLVALGDSDSVGRCALSSSRSTF